MHTMPRTTEQKFCAIFFDDEYKGWIIYIAADSVIQNTSFDFIGNLSIMRENKRFYGWRTISHKMITWLSMTEYLALILEVLFLERL
jgi:hypothetical protein